MKQTILLAATAFFTMAFVDCFAQVPPVLQIEASNNAATVDVAGQSGTLCTLQSAPEPSGPWTFYTNFIQPNGLTRIEQDKLAQSGRFFRAVSALMPANGTTNSEAYIARLGNNFAMNRIRGGFLEFISLWSDLIDGAVLGTNVNTSGGQWLTLRGNAIQAFGNPEVLDYGVRFNGTNQFARLTGLTDTQAATVVIIYSDPTGNDGSIASLRNESTGQSVGFWSDKAKQAMLSKVTAIGASVVVTNPSFALNTGGFVLSPANPEEHTFVVTFDGTNVNAYTDGYIKSNSVALPAGASTGSMNAFNLAATFDSAAGATNFWGGTLKAFLAYRRVLSTSEIQSALLGLRWFDLRTTNYVFVGDSMSCHIQDFRMGQNWPFQLMNSPSNTNKFFYRNLAINGAYTTTFGAWQYGAVVKQFKPGGPVNASFLFYRLGPNDLGSSLNPSADSIFSNMTNFWAPAKQDGFNLNVLTITTATNYPGFAGHLAYTVEEDLARQNLNGLIVEHPELYDRCWRADLWITDMLTNRSPWSYDGLHQNAAGYKLIADTIAASQ